MTRTSVMTLVYRAVDSAIADGLLVEIQRSDFARQIALRVLKARWPQSDGRLPSPSAAANDVQLTRIEALLRQPSLVRDLRAAAGLVGTVVQAVEALLAARSPQTSTRAFSEEIGVWAGQATVEGRTPDAAACSAFAAALVDRHLRRPARLSTSEFLDAQGPRWHARWASVGAPNLAAHPPSVLSLGSDRQPPMTRPDGSRRRNDWSQGTDRAVYDRYSLHFSTAAGYTPRECVDSTCRTSARFAQSDLATAEVDRACEPWGLAHPHHRQVLRSVASGLAADPQSPGEPTTWAEFRTPCRPIDLTGTTDAGVTRAVASALTTWRTVGVGRSLARDYGDLWGYQHVVETAVLRRAWMDLLGRERTYATPARRCWLPGTLSPALNHAAPDAVHRWFHGEDLFGLDSVTRSEATVDLLSQHPDIALALLRRDDDARRRYLDLVDATGPSRQAFLAPADALALLEDYQKRALS